MSDWLKKLLRRDGAQNGLEKPWSVLRRTTGGIGRAPASLRSIPSLNDEDFEELYYGELDQIFWHQGTIYASTPFAVDEILSVVDSTNPERCETLLEWVRICLESERIGKAKPCYAGVWIPKHDVVKLKVGEVFRPSVELVVQRHRSTLKRIAGEESAPSTQETVTKLLALLPDEGIGG